MHNQTIQDTSANVSIGNIKMRTYADFAITIFQHVMSALIFMDCVDENQFDIPFRKHDMPTCVAPSEFHCLF